MSLNRLGLVERDGRVGDPADRRARGRRAWCFCSGGSLERRGKDGVEFF